MQSEGEPHETQSIIEEDSDSDSSRDEQDSL